MNCSVKRFFSGLIFDGLMPIAAALLIAALIWHANPPKDLSYTIPPAGAVHTQRIASYRTEEQINEAIKLAAPAKTGYSVMEAEPEAATLAEEQPDPLEEG